MTRSPTKIAILRAALLLFPFAVAAAPSHAAEPDKTAVVYKDPQCGCCTGYARHLRSHGYSVKVVETGAMDEVKRRRSVPARLASCHTTVIGKYVVEGHVPVKHVDRLLRERPNIAGIALPGMPAGSPGMGGAKTEAFVIYELGQGAPKRFAID